MKPLVNFYDGEPWFDNPLLTVANPKRRKTAMRKRRRSRRGRKASPRRVRRNFYSAGALANRPRRRRRTRRSRARAYKRNVYMPLNPRRRKRGRRRMFRRNPALLGFQLPPMDAVLYTAAGFIGPGLVCDRILSAMPASWKTNTDGSPNQITIWAAKILSVALPAWAIKRFINPRAGAMFLIGGAAGLAMDAIRTFTPDIAKTLHLSGMGAQPLLGSYFTRPQAVVNFPRQARVPAMISDAPSRLNPQERF